MKNKILIIGNGGIAKTAGGRLWGNGTTGDFLVKLQEHNYKVTYIAHRGDAVKNKFLYNFDLSQHNIRSYIIHGQRPKSYFSLIKLFFLILIHKHVYIFYPGGVSSKAGKFCKLLKKQYGVYVRGNGMYIFDNVNSNPNKAFEFNNKELLIYSSFLIIVSDKLVEELNKITIQKTVKIIKPMINWDIGDIYQRIAYTVNSKINLLFIGSLIELKGIYDLVKIAEILEHNNFNFNLKIIGDGVLFKGMLEKQKQGEISKNITFAGAIRNKPKLAKEYESADALVFTSRNEGFPRVLYEAMLKTLPVFTTFVGGIPGLMQHNYNCIEIPVRDPEGQARVIMENINKPELLQRIAENGLITVKEVLTTRKPHHEVLIDCIENKE